MPPPSIQKLTVEGMHCGSCVGRVERALTQAAGVDSVDVSLLTETATIRTALSADRLIDVIEAAGYAAKTQSPDTEHQVSDTSELRRDTLLAALLAIPVFLLEMGSHLFPAVHHLIMSTIGQEASWAIQFVLTTTILVWPGRQFFKIGVPALLKAAPDMNSLVALGTAAAWSFSTVALLIPSVLPESARAVYFEAAAVIVTLILLGRLLEANAKGRTGKAIRQLLDLTPPTALVVRDGQPQEIAVSEIISGDLVQLRPGERVATDGQVVEGTTYIDECMMTGEPTPVAKTIGDEIVGGTLNGTGTLSFRATRIGEETVLAQIIQMIETAQGARLPVQDLVNRITLWFVPSIIAIAIVTSVIWFFFSGLSFALVTAVAVLIIACPCAMGLATPTSIMVGTGRAAELGILFRQGAALQTLHDVQTIVFDKTGTLTEGKPQISHFECAEEFTEAEILPLIASAEARSEHPIAQAVLDRARESSAQISDLESFDARPGYGVQARIEGREVLVGAGRMMEAEGIDLGRWRDRAATLAAEGSTPLYAAIDGKLAALIAVADLIKPTSKNAIKALKIQGFHISMVTGDATGTARAVANQLGIDEVVAEVLPAGKTDAIEGLRQAGSVAFVGDGINDGPALAAADVGIAVGTGSDVAIETADVVLMSGDLRGVVTAVTVSRQTMRNIRQNLFWAFGYNVLLIPVAAGLFYPLFGMLLSPMLAAGAMAASSVLVVTNALRLRWIKPEKTSS